MRRYITTLVFTLASVASYAQLADGKIKINDLKIAEDGEQVSVNFTAGIDPKAARSNTTLVFAPMLTDGTYKVSMPAVVVQGNQARRQTHRYEWVSAQEFAYNGATYARNGETIEYKATVPSQEWMQGADLVIESVIGGCCTYQSQPELAIARNIHLREPVTLVVEIPEVKCPEHYIFVPETLADTLSISFPFVVNAQADKERDPLNIYDDERDNALIVYYGVGSSVINKTYRGNEQILLNLTEVVNLIKSDPNSRVKNIVIAGFSSPEGNYEQNDRLAFERAVSVKRHIMETTGVPDGDILIYNGSVDWRGLRYMVSKSNILERDRIIEIIDNTPVWDSKAQNGRLGELMRMNGGVTYRYLLREYFPLMRNGAFIKVYYENK